MMLNTSSFFATSDVYRYEDSTPGTLLYQAPALYLNGNRQKYKMEFPRVPYLPEPQLVKNDVTEVDDDGIIRVDE